MDNRNRKIKYYAGTVDGKEWGFYLDPKNLQPGYSELTEKEHDDLINANYENGKIIKFQKNKKPIAVDYIPTREETLNQELRKLKTFLNETDYVSAKIAEGAATREEYKSILDERQAARNRINEIKSELEK